MQPARCSLDLRGTGHDPSSERVIMAAPSAPRQRLVIGVTGSSGPQIGYALLEALASIDSVETHLVVSRGAEKSIDAEMGVGRRDFEALAEVVYDAGDLAAAISSGSFVTAGMAVVPCSMKTLGAV